MDKILQEKISHLTPDIQIVSEENVDEINKFDRKNFWLIDPIDGTVNYVYNMPGSNICIAAKDSEGVQVGVVISPSVGGFWYAHKGGGAFYNGKPIKCNDPVTLDRALICTGFSYDLDMRVKQAELFSKMITKVRDVRRLGSAGVDLCYVAMGVVDGFYEYGLNEWDMAAGGLIATEAGALMSGRNGGPAGKEMTIIAGPTLHAQLVAEVG